VVTSVPHTLAVLASGQGTNFEALVLAERRGEIPGRIAVLLSDRPDAPVLERARRLEIEALVPPSGPRRTWIEDERPWIEALRQREVDVVLLAGFMRRLRDPFLEAFPDRILNIHPSLLPAFPGLSAIERAWEQGVSVTGCTVHVVDRELDHGPIVAREEVEVRRGETLESLENRIHDAEHRLYPAAVRRFLLEPWTKAGDRLEFGPRELRRA
jgi:phosphoribosylglycinamide formyltransferase-1